MLSHALFFSHSYISELAVKVKMSITFENDVIICLVCYLDQAQVFLIFLKK